MMIELRNDFHRTTTRVRTSNGRLTAAQVRRAERALCGMADCACSGHGGVRDDRLRVEPDYGTGGYRIVDMDGQTLDPARA